MRRLFQWQNYFLGGYQPWRFVKYFGGYLRMGVNQWIFQRISNLIIVIFGIWLLVFLASPGVINFEVLQDLKADTASVIFFSVTLTLAGLNSILAGWQIAGDYAEKFSLNQKFLVSITAIISLSYIAFGSYLLFF